MLTTLAVLFIAMVTGCDPQSKETTPPAATARTTARDVQEPGVPVPTTVSAAGRARSARHHHRGPSHHRGEPRDEDAGAAHSAFSMSPDSFSGSIVGA